MTDRILVDRLRAASVQMVIRYGHSQIRYGAAVIDNDRDDIHRYHRASNRQFKAFLRLSYATVNAAVTP